MAAAVWTEPLVDELRRLWPKRTASQIAAELGRMGFSFSRNAVIGKARRIGLPNKRDMSPRTPRAVAPRRESTRKFHKPAPPKPVSDAPATSPVQFVPRVVDTSPRMIPFAELNDGLCKYECSGQGDPTRFAFCGQPSNGTPYCSAHARLCYTPAPTRRRPYGRAA